MEKYITIFTKAWNSPTLTTWGSFLSKSLSLLIILPLVLNRFSTSEISLWYVFSAIISLQVLADLGFSPTFSRSIAYGMGGATQVKEFKLDNIKIAENRPPNWAIIRNICSTMKIIYFRLSIFVFFILLTLGTLSVWRPIQQIENPFYGWCAWSVIIFTSSIILFGNTYNSYLQGINKISLLRRWEIITSIGAILTSFLVILAGGKLLGIVIANQGWLVFNVVRNRFLIHSTGVGNLDFFEDSIIDTVIFQAIWPSAWRSAIGIFLTYGLVQITGIIYAQIASSADAASYLLALKLIQMIRQFSNAPFYSKIPVLSRLISEGKIQKHLEVASRGMKLTYWTFVAGFLAVGILGPHLLIMIKSNAPFVTPLLWSLIGLAFFLERYGALHLQLYSTTNHIIWHIVTGFSGIIYLLSVMALFPLIQVYAFPVGLIISYIGFYCWYSAKHSYKAFGMNPFEFEKQTVFLPAFLMLCYLSYSLVNFFTTRPALITS